MDDVKVELAGLAEDCRCGNLAAYERLYALEGRRMKSVAFHMLGSRQDAEDAVQEAFLRIYRSVASFREEASFTTWIYRILINACQDQRRRRQRRPETGPVDVSLATAAEAPAAVALEQALQRIDDRRRMVFLLFEAEGFAHAEIAAMLGTSESNSRYLLYEAKRELRKILDWGR